MTENATPLLDVRDLAVSFGENDNTVMAVKNASFTLNRGETLSLVGESGSGKNGDGPVGLAAPALSPCPPSQREHKVPRRGNDWC